MVASQTRTRPSELLRVTDPWVAIQLDRAVIWFGTFIENKLQEVHNVGSKQEPKIEPKYKLEDLLADTPQGKPTREQFIRALSGFGTHVKR